MSQDRLANLTERDRVVWRLVGQGLTNSAIAADLCISPDSARNCVKKLKGKLGAQVRTQLMAMAYQSGVVVAGSAEVPPGVDQLGDAAAESTVDTAREPAEGDDASRWAGEAVTPVDGSSGELVAAERVGHVQGSPLASVPKLRPRQRELIALLAEGLTVAQIAERMNVKKKAVVVYIGGTMMVLGLTAKQSWW